MHLNNDGTVDYQGMMMSNVRAATNSRINVIVWAEPLVKLAGELRAEVSAFRGIADGAAEAIERTAARLENTLVAATTGQWVLLEHAASLLSVTPHGLRARCRRSLAPRGLAEKRGGLWFIHVNALRTA